MASSERLQYLAKKYITKKLGIQSVPWPQNSVLFKLRSDRELFDSLFRKSPAYFFEHENMPYADGFSVDTEEEDARSIPLGFNCVQSIISLYGLQNNLIGQNPRWRKLIKDWNSPEFWNCGFPDNCVVGKTDDNVNSCLRAILSFLKACAVQRIAASQDPLIIIERSFAISDEMIVQKYFELVREEF